MQHSHDKRIVVTLDAGGTNFVFGAMDGAGPVGATVTLPAHAHDLDLCLSTMVSGFGTIIASLPKPPVAVSFAFPGSADYEQGVICGFLANFPSFRGGVALGPYLSRHLGLPVFINNDANLYVLGEAIGGIVPEVNARLAEAGSRKRYSTLVGLTLGTGLGFGIATGGRLHMGDNACTEAFCLPSVLDPGLIAEEGASARAVVGAYARLTGTNAAGLTPRDIFDIAEGRAAGSREAALQSFERLGRVVGEVAATAASLVDGLVVIGGGLTGAARYFVPTVLKVMRSRLTTTAGDPVGRLQTDVFDLDDDSDFALFAADARRTIAIHGSDRTIDFDPSKRIGIAISHIGTSRAVAIGAYANAMARLGCWR